MNKPVNQRKGSWLSTINAVLWGFLGVRRQTDYQSDIAKLNPLHIVAVGIVMAFLFVFGLMFLVHWIAG
jgi:uncharacterized membrane protein YidH (DUF202 family)